MQTPMFHKTAKRTCNHEFVGLGRVCVNVVGVSNVTQTRISWFETQRFLQTNRTCCRLVLDHYHHHHRHQQRDDSIDDFRGVGNKRVTRPIKTS
jgi:hypothetical protein